MAPYKTETADSLVICSHCGASLDCGETAIKAADGRFCSVECAQAAARARRNRRAREGEVRCFTLEIP